MRKLSTENSWAMKLKELKIVNPQCFQRSRIDKECKESIGISRTRIERVLFIFFTRTSLYFHTFSILSTFPLDCVYWTMKNSYFCKLKSNHYRKEATEEKSLHWFSTYLYDIIKRFCLYLATWNLENFITQVYQEDKSRTPAMYFVGFSYLVNR